MKFSKSMPVLVAALVLLSACGKAKFQKQDFQASAVAGQYSVTKPKIDIIVFQDNSDSVMYGPINTLQQQMQGFLGGLSDNWDFHFTVLPLLSNKTMNGKYVIASNCSDISGVTSCLSPSQANSFNNATGDYGWIRSVNSAVGSADKGFEKIYQNITQASMTSTGFLRPDAALAIIVISNGEDTTGVTYTTRSDGVQILDYNSPQSIAAYNTYKNLFSGLKGPSEMSKFYSVVSPGGNCYGSNSFRGQRYMDMSDDLGSRWYNLCNSELNYSLANIANQLQVVVQSVIFNYVVINESPMVGSIVVKKNGVTVPQSTSNGWSYEGYKSNHPTSFFPTSGNPRTGYFIKLNGSYTFEGTDQMTVNYQKN